MKKKFLTLKTVLDGQDIHCKNEKKIFGNFIFFMQKKLCLGQNWSDSPRTTLIKTAPVEFLPYKTLFQTPKTVKSDQYQLKSIKST